MYIKSCSFHTQCSEDPSSQSLEHDLVPINKPDANTHNWVHQMYVSFSNLSQYIVKRLAQRNVLLCKVKIEKNHYENKSRIEC